MPDSRQARIVIPLLSLAMLASFVLASWSLYSSHQSGCEARNKTLAVLHDVLLDAQVSRPSPNAHSDAFFRTEFARIQAARC